ncbi:putative ATP-dependent helicase DinG [Planctomycetes bacterium Pan216]|uniref:DNA 5'-3' helicase n=1 Tax=Kolteria novifilia TaxID=2527975 RepID=A0A518B8B6_9BACT|nr:putative ATP-dependent helicase DinG [Planctomycetes bacterium Pan216]
MITAEEMLGPGGRIARRLESYEPRSEQLAMATAVEKAIADERPLMVEAGTGVGKSFAYLVPALAAATAKDSKRVVISTNTISLQEQLIKKDIPFLRSLWPDEFSAVLVKGRSNYISLRRLQIAKERASGLLFEEEAHLQLRQIGQWAEDSRDGSLSDLGFQPLPTVWDEVQSDHGNCLGRSCPEHERCFYYSARRRVWGANILVVNHSLFFSDLALREQGVSILPDYKIAIFDEGHTLEESAAGHMGLTITNRSIAYTLNRIYNERTQKGVAVHYDFPAIRELSQRVRYVTEDFFSAIAEWLLRYGSQNGRVRTKGIVANQLTEQLLELGRGLAMQADSIVRETERIEFVALSNRCKALGQSIQSWLEQELDGFVYWLESRSRGNIAMVCAPVDVGSRLHQQIWTSVPTPIVTSATLGAGGSQGLAFMRDRLGFLDGNELELGSPFDYEHQARLVLVSQMPDPSSESARFEEESLRLIRYFTERSEGNAFVLFTSHRALRSAAEQLRAWFAHRRLPLFSQSDGMPRGRMLEEFRRTPGAVLFGTDSFWQGVDVPGDALRSVIITRLPFSVPDRPIIEARLDAIRERGGNPFREYSLPEAVIKFKQGFGRLIRTKSDSGEVVVLDSRILTKQYGGLFLDALPDCPREIVSRQQLGGRGSS